MHTKNMVPKMAPYFVMITTNNLLFYTLSVHFCDLYQIILKLKTL